MTDDMGDWSAKQFEQYGAEVLAAIREHFETIRDTPVGRPYDVAKIIDGLSDPLPEAGESFGSILADTRKRVIPDLVHWNHPNFYGYFPTSASFAGVLAETMTAAVNVNAMLWKTSPAASALETVVLRWLAEMTGYDQQADGVLLNGASLATLYALTVARDAAVGARAREEGIGSAGRLRVYASDQAHSSVEKAAMTLGMGRANLVRIPSDAGYRMQPDALEDTIRADIQAGSVPVAVVATVGTTSTGAADDLKAIAEICRRHNVWLHVDAAYGGFYSLCPSLNGRLEDVSVGDSLVVNPQKTLFVPLDATALYCRRKGAMAATFRLVPEYLTSQQSNASFDYMDLSPQLGRGFRALKLWWVLRTFGRQGLSTRLEHAVSMADHLRRLAAGHPDWTCVTSSPYPLVCLRYTPAPIDGRAPLGRKDTDDLNARILAAVNDSGRAYLSHSVIRDGYVIRVSIGNIRTTPADLAHLWRLLTETAEAQHRREPA